MLWRAIHIFALAGFAVAQPLFSLLGAEQEFWIARDAGYVDVAFLIVVVVGVIPGVILLIEWLVGLVSEQAGWIVHLTAIAGLFALIALDVVDTVTGQSMRGLYVMAIAALAGGVLALAYARLKFVRDFVGILAIGPLVFTALLIFSLPPLGDSDASTVDVGITSGSSVVFVVLDEFQLAAILDESGSIDASRFPNFARLAESSTWYPNATTVHDNTLKAVPAILSGSYPSNDKLPTADDYPVNLFTTLGGTHEMVVTEAVTQLCPTAVCDESLDSESMVDHLATLSTDSGIIYLHAVVPSTLRYRLPPIGTRWEGFLRSSGESTDSGQGDQERGPIEAAIGAQTGDEARSLDYGAFLDSFNPARGPSLYYLHVDLPHAPWSMLSSGKRYPYSDWIPSYSPEGIWHSDPWYVEQAFRRYTENIAFTDLLIGATLDRLTELDMLEDSVVVFVSDHGENFEPDETRRAITSDTLAALGGVPLFVKYPGQTVGAVDESNAQTIDLLPTMIDSLGGTQHGLDGRSLLSDSSPAQKRLLTNSGAEFILTMAEYLDLVADHREDVFAMSLPGNGFATAYAAAGPVRELNGVSIASVEVSQRGGSTEVSSQSFVTSYDPTGPLDPVAIPVVVTVGEGIVPRYFAIAVNGTILTTMSPYAVDGDTASIYAIVPPNSFDAGSNMIEVFGIDDSGASLALVRYG